MSETFEDAQGRVMVREGPAGGVGGGVTGFFHRIATEAEAAAFRALHAVEVVVEPEAPPAPEPEPEPEPAPEAPEAAVEPQA